MEGMKKTVTEFREVSDVSVDVTWQGRGHSSHRGVVTAISVENGKCIDTEILSNICSDGAMEAACAVNIFMHSVETRNICYIQYDGDSSSYKKVVDSKPFGEKPIKKLE
ncbi:forkhead box protein k1 [Biomphalaria glabrata]|nr:hypothetical protein BgiMline_031057 [Biomphalaria glabrata]